MKKLILFPITILFITIIQAQNVGIGTATPTEKLEIKNLLKSTVKISAGSLSDTTQLIFSNKGSTAGFYTDFSIKSIRENGLFFSSQSDLPTNNSANSLVIRPEGNVGIGISIPAFKLDVIGDINTTGLLRLNGASGAAGQVLTSNGAADPAWQTINQNPAIGCMVGLTSNFTGSGYAMLPLDWESLGTTYFDDGNIFDPVSNNFTAPSLGVYHFDVGVHFDSPPVGSYSLMLVSSATGSGFYGFSTIYVPVAGTANTTINLSITIKMTAGSKMWVYLNRPNLVTVVNTSGTKFSAYKVY